MKSFGQIYIIKSPSHKVYIGQTIDTCKNRFRDHCYDAFDPKKDHCKKLNRAFRKYGKKAFFRETLVFCETQEELNHYETFYIKVFDSITNGYNLKEGGANGLHLEETNIKISNALKGKPKIKSMRKNLSKARNKAGLPMYLITTKNGYRVVNHPMQNGKERRFANTRISDMENFQRALNCLNELNKLQETQELNE